MDLKRAVFLRGVWDPADPSRITTTLYRPRHPDLRLENGFVRCLSVLVPVSNCVELLLYTHAFPDMDPPKPKYAPDTYTVAPEQAAQLEQTTKRRGRPPGSKSNPTE